MIHADDSAYCRGLCEVKQGAKFCDHEFGRANPRSMVPRTTFRPQARGYAGQDPRSAHARECALPRLQEDGQGFDALIQGQGLDALLRCWEQLRGRRGDRSRGLPAEWDRPLVGVRARDDRLGYALALLPPKRTLCAITRTCNPRLAPPRCPQAFPRAPPGSSGPRRALGTSLWWGSWDGRSRPRSPPGRASL